MSPAEASAIEFEEPDWNARFLTCLKGLEAPTVAQRLSTPAQIRLAAEDTAFERTLKDWRRFHATDDKPAGAVEAMIALAKLKILPPRSLIKDIERAGACFQDQHDDHMWLTMSQRAWRIVAIDSRVMFLESFGEQTQVDLVWAKPRWEKWVDKAVEAMEAWTK